MLLFALPCLFLLVHCTPAPLLRTPNVSEAPHKGRYFVSSAPRADLNDAQMKRANYLDVISPRLFLKSFKQDGSSRGAATSPFNSPADYFAQQRAYSAYSPAQAAPASAPFYAPSAMSSPVPTVTYDATAYQQTLQPPAAPTYAAQAQPAQPTYAAQAQPSQPTYAAQAQPAQPTYAAQAQPAQPEAAVYNVVAQPQRAPTPPVAQPVYQAAPVAAAPVTAAPQLIYAHPNVSYPQAALAVAAPAPPAYNQPIPTVTYTQYAPQSAPAPSPVYSPAPAQPVQYFRPPQVAAIGYAAAPAPAAPAPLLTQPFYAPRAMTVPMPTITVAAPAPAAQPAAAPAPVFNFIRPQTLQAPVYPSNIVVPQTPLALPAARPIYAQQQQSAVPSTPVYIQQGDSSPSKNPFQISYLPQLQTAYAAQAQTAQQTVGAAAAALPTVTMSFARPALSYLQIQNGQQG